MPGRLLLFVALAAIAGAFHPAAVDAQTTALTGAIEGRLTDGSGAALGGVAIGLESGALMGDRSSTTDADGSYRFGALPPGLYEISFALAGFHSTTRSDIRVGLGETRTVNATLDVAAREGVIVSAQVLALDRRATMLTTTFDAIRLDQLPGSRTPDAILSMTPSVQQVRFDVGGSSALSPILFGAYGIVGASRPTIEGISLAGYNMFGVGLDFGSFEQVFVGLGSYGPEWPAPGVHIQFITKSGGNQYRGGLYAGYQSGQWQSRNIDAGQVARGAASSQNVAARDANRLRDYRDLNADAGGFIRRDRLWWYGSLRDQRTSARQIAFVPEPLRSELTAGTGKVTLGIGNLNRAVFFVHASENRQPIRLDAFQVPAATVKNESRESTSSRAANSVAWKAEWNGIVANRIFFVARVSRFTARAMDRPNDSSPRSEDVVSHVVTGGNRDWQQGTRTTQASASLGYAVERWAGRHYVTAGTELQSRIDTEEWHRAYPGDTLNVLSSGSPSEVYLFSPSRSESGQHWLAAYANDTWQPGARLTLNLGIRLDQFRIFLPEQIHPAGRFNAGPTSFPAVTNVADWTVVAPRIAGSFDVLGNGRTLAKVSYGRYWLPPSTDLGFNVNRNPALWWELYKWQDTNRDGAWNWGEQLGLVETRGGETSISIDPDLKLAYVREITARIEQEVAGGFTFQTGIIWRGERQQGARQRAGWPFEAFDVVSTISDPGPDGVIGNDDDGEAIRVHDIRPELIGLQATTIRNTVYSDGDYLTWEAVAQRRTGRRWSFFGSVSHTWHHDHANGYLGQPVRANEFPATPNDLIHTDERGRHAFTTWSAKAMATYDGPWGITAASVVRHQSGQPFGRTLLVRGLASGNVRVLTEPVGARRQEHLTVADLRISRTFGRQTARQVTAFVEVFNLLNSNAEQSVNWSTPEFLKPLAITPPRIARVGIRVAW